MRSFLFLLIGLSLVGCSSEGGDTAGEEEGETESAVVSAGPSMETVLTEIRAGSLSRKIKKGWLLAGIGKVETQLVHCRPVNLYCSGPVSADCGGGPVLAGGADGPCKKRLGGLGIFQLDDGTQTQTVNNYKSKGIDILTVKGNVQGGIEVLFAKLKLDRCVPGIDTDEQAVAWLNGIQLGTPEYEQYTGLLANCYNGWDVGVPGWKKQKAKYDAGIRDVLAMHGETWWTQP